MAVNFAGTPIDTYKMASGLYDAFSKGVQDKQRQEYLDQQKLALAQDTELKQKKYQAEQDALQRQRASYERHAPNLALGLRQAAFGGQQPGPASSGDAASVIRGFEGYRDKPYWDVNAHRGGYGSDTITRADGTIMQVQPGMQISREDAERDLQRRITTEFQPRIVKEIGEERWNSLAPNAQAALTSVAYNYGRLPFSVGSAVATGDANQIAAAVEGLRGHNNGINANRRAQEAALIRGQGGQQVAQADLPAPGAQEVQFQAPQLHIPGHNPNAGASIQAGQLLSAMLDPDAPAGVKEVAKLRYNQLVDDAKIPSIVKEYQYAKAEGYTGTLADFKKSGAVSVNVGKEETEYDKAAGKGFWELNKEILDAGQKSQRSLAIVGRLRGLLQEPGVYQGAGGQLAANAKAWLEAAGIATEGVGATQAAQAVANQFALELRNPSGGAGMPGALSDKDREFLVQMVPGLTNTREGNLLLADYMEKLNQRNIDIDRLRREYVAKNKRLDEGFYDVLANWSTQSPMFNDSDIQGAKVAMSGATAQGDQRQGQPVRVQSPDEARRLPSGTPIILPDGTQGRVP